MCLKPFSLYHMFFPSMLTLVGWSVGPSSEAGSRARAFLAASGYSPHEDAELAKKLQEVRSVSACDGLELPRTNQTLVSQCIARAAIPRPLDSYCHSQEGTLNAI